VNPWHFKAALSPLLAARKERKRVRLAQVVRHVQSVARRFEAVVVEGAGGLLSPLGEDFDSRDLIIALKAVPVIVASNTLGAVGQVRLALNALPRRLAKDTEVILVNPPRPTAASRTNAALLRESVPGARIQELPWIRFQRGPL
jgi:dethiobiotin synthetase